ncbi:MAG TPA: right-handed parallel beta-helix repeat-containing protein [Chthoniobacterales bacterium]
MNKSQLSLAIASLAIAVGCPCEAATYTVNSLADSPGQGTLRWAINEANAHPGSTIDFDVSGTIVLSSPLPIIEHPTTIDGSSAPNFHDSPVVALDCSGKPGLTLGLGAHGSIVQSLSVGGARGAGINVLASGVTIVGNYIGLSPSGKANGNSGDGVRVVRPSSANLIGGFNPVRGVQYFDTSNSKAFTIPVDVWQGLRNYGSSGNQFLMCGTSGDLGVVYTGPIAGGGNSYNVKFPGSRTTSVYGPDNLQNGSVRLVGSYVGPTTKGVVNHGFVWEGSLSDLPNGGLYRRIDYPGAKYQFVHSTMGGLAVGNAATPAGHSPRLGPGVAYIYDLSSGTFVATIQHPHSRSNTAYGIWHNGGTSYTICGGYSPLPVNNIRNQDRPLADGRAFLVDYDSATGQFSHWSTFRYRNGKAGRSFVTHFEGISSVEPGVYTMSADSVKRGSNSPAQGSWVTVRRNTDGSFGTAQWVDLNFTGTEGVTSSNSVYGWSVVGVVAGTSPLAFQGVVQIGFQLSNVISANGGNGVGLYGSNGNIIAQNYIGTNPSGTAAMSNGRNGILLISGASRNLIGGQAAGANNPTGSKGATTPVFVVPPQGNLVSGNRMNGVLIADASVKNTLSGNFIGTNRQGNAAIGNRLDGVRILRSNRNSLTGCTFQQNPFVFYNVVSGNGLNGVEVESSDNITIQGNFMGVGANNGTLVPNGIDGLVVSGSSRNLQAGGVIPLGSVISGNRRNGIFIQGTVTGFVSFNNFCGGFAFGGAAPNGADGILITSTGGNNLVRTCILSGNNGNGLEIGGDASGVQVEDTACGTNTAIHEALPNQGSGVLISGTAHNNYLGGLQPSVEMRTHFAGNMGYGVAIVGQAHDNFIYNSNIGVGFSFTNNTPDPAIPNQSGGIYLGAGTSNTTIGGTNPIQQNDISSNIGAGLTIVSSTGNAVTDNQILENSQFGVFATGACDGTSITTNTISGNGSSSADDVNISGATGITYTP